MSRTDKDRPFWVQMNDPGNPVDHDHASLGKTVYGRKYHSNPDGTPLFKTEKVSATAEDILEAEASLYGHPHLIWGETDRVRAWHPRIDWFPEGPVIRAARLARDNPLQGPDTLVFVGTHEYRSFDLVELYTISEHCTEGAKATSDNPWGWSSEVPCTPTLPSHLGGWRIQTRNKSKAKTSIRRTRNGMSRVKARDTLKDLAKNWNAGEDIEDVEDRALPLTGQHRHSMVWDLY